MPVLRFALIVATLLAVVGCRGTAKPQIFAPAGSAEYQQQQAQRFDPYPETNVGPSVGGGRPDSYTAPPPENVRGRPNQWTFPLWPR